MYCFAPTQGRVTYIYTHLRVETELRNLCSKFFFRHRFTGTIPHIKDDPSVPLPKTNSGPQEDPSLPTGTTGETTLRTQFLRVRRTAQESQDPRGCRGTSVRTLDSRHVSGVSGHTTSETRDVTEVLSSGRRPKLDPRDSLSQLTVSTSMSKTGDWEKEVVTRHS